MDRSRKNNEDKSMSYKNLVLEMEEEQIEDDETFDHYKFGQKVQGSMKHEGNVSSSKAYYSLLTKDRLIVILSVTCVILLIFLFVISLYKPSHMNCITKSELSAYVISEEQKRDDTNKLHTESLLHPVSAITPKLQTLTTLKPKHVRTTSLSTTEKLTKPTTQTTTIATEAPDQKSVPNACGQHIPLELFAVSNMNSRDGNQTSYIKVNGEMVASIESKGLLIVRYHPTDVYFENAVKKEYQFDDSVHDIQMYINDIEADSVILALIVNLTSQDAQEMDDIFQNLKIEHSLMNDQAAISIAYYGKKGQGVLEEDISDQFAGPVRLFSALETLPCGCQLGNATMLYGGIIKDFPRGLSNKIVHIYGRISTLENRVSFNLWSRDKSKIIFHHDMRYDDGQICINSHRNADPNRFPNGPPNRWDSHILFNSVLPIKRGTTFHAEIKISSHYFIITINDCYEHRVFPVRYRVSLDDITWFTISGEYLDNNEICIW